MKDSFQEKLDYSFVEKVNNTQNAGYSRAQSHLDYVMNKDYAQHPEKCNIYEKSHINSVPAPLYSDVVDLESELINRTRKLSKCSSRKMKPDTECKTCSHGQECSTSECFKDGGLRKGCNEPLVQHTKQNNSIWGWSDL